MNQTSAKRIARLREVLREQGVDAFFAATPATMGYLAECREGGGERMLLLGIAPDRPPEMLTPALSLTQARETTGIADITSWMDGEDPGAKFQQWAERWELRSGVIAVDDGMPASHLIRMQEALPAALFKRGDPILELCRGIKDEVELENLHEASRIIDRVYAAALAEIETGMTESEVAGILREETNAQGVPQTFCIVAAGGNGAKPHYLTGDRPLRRGDVVVLDFGCHVNGYQSDITRTIAIGEASDEAKRVYQIVRDAHNAARAVARPGVQAQEVDRAARKVITDAGYGEFFVHRTGHGIGQQGHEPPYIVEGNETTLRPGHCFTDEPGIYLPGKFGVRIENVCTITADGCRSLNADAESELPVIPG